MHPGMKEKRSCTSRHNPTPRSSPSLGLMFSSSMGIVPLSITADPIIKTAATRGKWNGPTFSGSCAPVSAASILDDLLTVHPDVGFHSARSCRTPTRRSSHAMSLRVRSVPLNQKRTLTFCLCMIFSENRFPSLIKSRTCFSGSCASSRYRD